MTFKAVIRALQASLAAALPGQEAQLRMARRPRPGFVPGSSPPDCRHGAVLLLLYPKRDEAHVVLTLRSESLSHHRGQVSLPGGRIEADESPAEAAVREATEEIGIRPVDVRVLGGMTSFHLPVSRFVVHPVIAWAEHPPELRIASPEVERIIEVPLTQILDPGRVRLESRLLDGVDSEVPYFELAGYKVWGATAMVLSELLALLGIEADPWSPRAGSSL